MSRHFLFTFIYLISIFFIFFHRHLFVSYNYILSLKKSNLPLWTTRHQGHRPYWIVIGYKCRRRLYLVVSFLPVRLVGAEHLVLLLRYVLHGEFLVVIQDIVTRRHVDLRVLYARFVVSWFQAGSRLSVADRTIHDRASAGVLLARVNRHEIIDEMVRVETDRLLALSRIGIPALQVVLQRCSHEGNDACIAIVVAGGEIRGVRDDLRLLQQLILAFLVLFDDFLDELPVGIAAVDDSFRGVVGAPAI